MAKTEKTKIKPVKPAKIDYRKLYENELSKVKQLEENAVQMQYALEDAQDIAVLNLTGHILGGLVGNSTHCFIGTSGNAAMDEEMDETLDRAYKLAERLVTRFRGYMGEVRERREKEKQERQDAALEPVSDEVN